MFFRSCKFSKGDFWGVGATSKLLCLHGHVEVIKWPLDAVWEIRLGAAKLLPQGLLLNPLRDPSGQG